MGQAYGGDFDAAMTFLERSQRAEQDRIEAGKRAEEERLAANKAPNTSGVARKIAARRRRRCGARPVPRWVFGLLRRTERQTGGRPQGSGERKNRKPWRPRRNKRMSRGRKRKTQRLRQNNSYKS